MKKYSLTQSGNLTVIIGMVMLVLKYLNINIAQEEIQILIGGILAIVGVMVSWYGRYRKGDLRLSGVRKNGQDLPPQGII